MAPSPPHSSTDPRWTTLTGAIRPRERNRDQPITLRKVIQAEPDILQKSNAAVTFHSLLTCGDAGTGVGVGTRWPGGGRYAVSMTATVGTCCPSGARRLAAMYKLLFTVLFRHVDPETAHHLGFGLIRLAGRVPGLSLLLSRWLVPRDDALRVRTLGFEVPGPLGLAAGFDKDALGPDALGLLGFGHVEVGTLTAGQQPGNPRPRLFRLTGDRALINRMGFNNAGAAAAARRLERRRARADHRGRRLVVTGVNIGKTKIVPEAEATEDYVTSARLLAGVADYLVVNVSSPNTPGLRDLQAVEKLRPLLAGVRAALDSAGPRRVPLLVKIAPDLDDADIDAVADLALDLALDGIVATNTTVTRGGLRTDAATVEALGAGGLSGAPLRDRSLEVLRRLRSRVGDRLVLVASGGIETPENAWQRILAGATLVQTYTAFIYHGPLWPRRLQTGLARLARDAGFATVQEAVGTGVTPDPR